MNELPHTAHSLQVSFHGLRNEHLLYVVLKHLKKWKQDHIHEFINLSKFKNTFVDLHSVMTYFSSRAKGNKAGKCLDQ